MNKEEFYKHLDKDDLVRTIVDFSDVIDNLLKESVEVSKELKEKEELIKHLQTMVDKLQKKVDMLKR